MRGGDRVRVPRVVEGAASGDHLEEHERRRVDVDLRPRLPAAELLGRRVAQRPEERPAVSWFLASSSDTMPKSSSLVSVTPVAVLWRKMLSGFTSR